MKEILLITPPFTQLNTPYPATQYLKGFLNTKEISSFQMDLGIEVVLELFTEKSFSKIFKSAAKNKTIQSPNAQRIYSLRMEYLKVLESVVTFLQGKNPSLARQICSHTFLPQAARFEQLEDMEWAFGTMGIQDKAKHFATLFLEDLSDFIVECLDANFGFSRYAERLGQSANSFDELHAFLAKPPSLIDELSHEIIRKRMEEVQPKLICFSVPFPGNLYSAFSCAQYLKKHFPAIKIVMGGGFPNTELRSLTDVRVFDFFDFITLDDGELPIELVYKNVVFNKIEKDSEQEFKRTFLLKEGKVFYNNTTRQADYKQSEMGTPDYSDLFVDRYISVIEMANPMHSLWSDGRWNKLTMAHGCYWGKCTFCDVSLDYVKLYEPIAAKQVVDRMETIMAQTGENGFHFVDEAAPPALMKALAIEILQRGLVVTWWTNIRFEKSFTLDLCLLFKESGCIAVSGGLEVASDRLLALIDKGVTVSQVAKTTRNFREADIMVHSYLMYGYPSQTVQETVDSLELVRQLFEIDVLQSGFWHQFALTAHSPIGRDPDVFGVLPKLQEISFANNDVQFEDKTGIDHSQFSFGLKKSLFNYMYGIGFDLPLQDWFDFKIPKTSISKDYIENCIHAEVPFELKANSKLLWVGSEPLCEEFKTTKNGTELSMYKIELHSKTALNELKIAKKMGDWLLPFLKEIDVKAGKPIAYKAAKEQYEKEFESFELFWFSETGEILRASGLLIV